MYLRKVQKYLWWHEWLAALVIACMMLGAAGLAAQEQQAPPIQCYGAQCLIERSYLESIVRQANRAEEYLRLCGWAR